MNINAEKSSEKFSFKSLAREWGPFFIFLLLVFLVCKYVIVNAYIPSESMVPALNKGDRLIVTQIWNKDNVSRGDIIVFNSDELNEVLIKRAIGLPGDHIEIKNGTVKVNGEELQEDYVVNQLFDYEGTFDVPQDRYFFLGDNRANSLDSRFWQNPYIDKDKVIGKAVFKYYPLDDIKSLNNSK